MLEWQKSKETDLCLSTCIEVVNENEKMASRDMRCMIYLCPVSPILAAPLPRPAGMGHSCVHSPKEMIGLRPRSLSHHPVGW